MIATQQIGYFLGTGQAFVCPVPDNLDPQPELVFRHGGALLCSEIVAASTEASAVFLAYPVIETRQVGGATVTRRAYAESSDLLLWEKGDWVFRAGLERRFGADSVAALMEGLGVVTTPTPQVVISGVANAIPARSTEVGSRCAFFGDSSDEISTLTVVNGSAWTDVQRNESVGEYLSLSSPAKLPDVYAMVFGLASSEALLQSLLTEVASNLELA